MVIFINVFRKVNAHLVIPFWRSAIATLPFFLLEVVCIGGINCPVVVLNAASSLYMTLYWHTCQGFNKYILAVGKLHVCISSPSNFNIIYKEVELYNKICNDVIIICSGGGNCLFAHDWGRSHRTYNFMVPPLSQPYALYWTVNYKS